MSEDEIIAKLLKELSLGGTLFEGIMGSFGNIAGEMVDYVSVEQVHEEWKGINRWTWVTVKDADRCDDCAERDGQVKTWEEWEALGLPGLGATVCGWRCRCTLEPG
ncbi:MAG: phage minor head protein [Candidatus Omnitrophica bacterium]|nr:phage minor head protein [Candidatus Omnitrophota bacterium]